MKPIPEKTAVRGIIRRGNKLFLVKRIESSSYGSHWQFAGGKTDGEEPVSALKREIEEETGLIIDNIRKFKTFYNGTFWTMFFIASAKGNPSLQQEEISDSGWFTKEEAKELPLTPETKQILNFL